ncbi:MAG: hypothetical protein OK436_01150 [Thaumarchaeota archaeon]|nr:hypothetical protein [Nitrososphaerota archaeon]
MGVILILLGGTFSSAVYAVDTASLTATPSVAPQNTTIFLENKVTMGGVAGASVDDFLEFVLVLAPSGTIYGAAAYSQFLSGLTPGTGQCTLPFGGPVAALSLSTTGGVSIGSSLCNSGSLDSTLWGAMGVLPACALPCNGPSDFAAATAACTGPSVANTGPLPPISKGDTTQPGTYMVLSCWIFNDNSPSAAAMPLVTSFLIQASNGVPQFPLGFALLIGIAVPVMVLLRRTYPVETR